MFFVADIGLDILDSALLRPGRIDRKIEFPPPGPEARVSILRIHSRKVGSCSRFLYVVSLTAVISNRCRYNEASTFAHSQRKWGNVLEPKFVASAQRRACMLFASGDSMSRRKISSLPLLRFTSLSSVNATKKLTEYTGTEEEPRGQHISQQTLLITSCSYCVDLKLAFILKYMTRIVFAYFSFVFVPGS